jgi:hypothetical protein
MRRIAVAFVTCATAAGSGRLLVQRSGAKPSPDALYCNVDIRQIDLSFNAEGMVSCRYAEAQR